MNTASIMWCPVNLLMCGRQIQQQQAGSEKLCQELAEKGAALAKQVSSSARLASKYAAVIKASFK